MPDALCKRLLTNKAGYLGIKCWFVSKKVKVWILGIGQTESDKVQVLMSKVMLCQICHAKLPWLE